MQSGIWRDLAGAPFPCAPGDTSLDMLKADALRQRYPTMPGRRFLYLFFTILRTAVKKPGGVLKGDVPSVTFCRVLSRFVRGNSTFARRHGEAWGSGGVMRGGGNSGRWTGGSQRSGQPAPTGL